MTTLSIKDVPDQWAQTLKERAARNHRSLQGELMAIIEAAIGVDGVMPNTGFHPPAQERNGVAIVRRGWKTPEQVGAEIKARFPAPLTHVLTGTEIIRAERDAR